MGYLEEKQKELQQELKDKIRKDFKEYDDKLYGLYVSQEAQKNYFLKHYHACALYMNMGALADPHTKTRFGKHILKHVQELCEDYLESQGITMDKSCSVCDSCPYMREVFLDDNDNILVVI